MQADNRPEWKDDADFWDDAWKDMQRRLDEHEQAPRRRTAAWWWLGLVGFALALFVTVYQPSAEEEPAAPTAPLAERETARQNATAEGPRSMTDKGGLLQATALDEGEPLQASSPSKGEIPQPPSPNEGPWSVPDEGEFLQASGPDGEKPLQSSGPDREPWSMPDEGGFLQASVLDEEKPPQASSSNEEAYPQASSPVTPPTREAIRPVTALPPVAPFLSGGKDAIPTVNFQRKRTRNNLDLIAGGTASTSFRRPGYFVGLGYQLNTGGRLRFPLGLRLRQDAIQISEINGRGLVAGNSGQAFDQSRAAEQLLADLAVGSFDEIRTLGVELTAAAALRVGRKWQLFGGLGAEYLLEARGPELSSEDARFADLSGTGSFVSLDIGSGGPYTFNESTAQPATGFPSTGDSAGPTTVNRLAYRAHFGLDYRFAPRLSVFAAGQFLLRPIYREEAASLRPGQLEVGLRYRWR